MIKEGFIDEVVFELDFENDELEIVREMDILGRKK